MAGAGDSPLAADARYSRVAIWFHWIIAALVLTNLTLGFLHDDFGKAATARIMFFHKSIGLTVLTLSLLRLGWRLGHRPPPFDPVVAGWEVVLARSTHVLFYLLMIAIPLSGWLLVSSVDRPVDYFGLFVVDVLPVPQGEDAKDQWEDVHEMLALAMLALVLLHVAGAAKHYLRGHRQVTARMLPWISR